MQKNIVSSLVAFLLFLGGSFANAGGSLSETPEEGLKTIVELYKKQDWEGLIRKRSLDTKHAVSEEDVEKLIANLGARYEDEAFLSALVKSYEAALSAKPQLKSEGTVAIFASESGSVKLSKMENGTWGLRF